MTNLDAMRVQLIAKNSGTLAANSNYRTLDQRNAETQAYRNTNVDRYNPSTRGNYNYFKPTNAYR